MPFVMEYYTMYSRPFLTFLYKTKQVGIKINKALLCFLCTQCISFYVWFPYQYKFPYDSGPLEHKQSTISLLFTIPWNGVI